MRNHEGATYFVVSDRLDKGDAANHTYSWEMTLNKDTSAELETLQSGSAILLSDSLSQTLWQDMLTGSSATVTLYGFITASPEIEALLYFS